MSAILRSAVHPRLLLFLATVTVMVPAFAIDTSDIRHNVNADAGIEYDDNVTLGSRDRDIESDVAAGARAAYRRTQAIGRDSAWGISAGLGTRQYVDFDRLSHVDLEAGGLWRQRFGSGFHAPVVEAGGTVTWIESQSDIRTGYRIDLRAVGTRRMTDRITARAGLNAMRRRASDGKVFDLERYGLFANADYFLGRDHVLYGTLALATGDVAVTVRGRDGDPDPYDYYAGLPWEPDDAFGGASRYRYAYRVDANLVTVTTGYNLTLDRRRSLDASLELTTADTEARDYERVVVRVQYLHRFELH